MEKASNIRNKKATILTGILAVLLIAVSLSLILYPTISEQINNISNRNKNTTYQSAVSTLTASEKEKLFEKARAYNIELNNPFEFKSVYAYKNTNDYTDVLNFNGQMGSICIPKIDVDLPIYHGTGEDKLSEGAVHLPNTSLPVGGIGTHSCISAHTAFPAKKFFDNLNELEIGDYFYIIILDETHTYKVTEKNIVEPNDTSLLKPDFDKDLVTLITCYPYAVNSHRLLVTGERVQNDSQTSAENALNEHEQHNEEKTLIVIGVAVLLLISAVTAIFIIQKKKKQRIPD